MAELFTPGQNYPVPDFLNRARIAMERASNRVQKKYGFACSSAMAQLDAIEARVAAIGEAPGAEIACLAISQ